MKSSSTIRFSDEATLHLYGTVNRYNCRTWGQPATSEVHRTSDGRAKVYAWCGMTKDRITGAFLLSGRNRQKPFVPGHVRPPHTAINAL
jgi:hypothetical protein